MWPEQVHILLTYNCNFECDHCFVYSGPEAEGTFTPSRLRSLLDQALAIDSVEWIYYEGGEPFLVYPLLVEGVREARHRGFQVGIVSNSYWADCDENARLWLEPFPDIADLAVSDDELHHGNAEDTPAQRAARVAGQMGIPSGSIRIDAPFLAIDPGIPEGEPEIGGNVRFRGRAVDKLIEGLPQRTAETMTTCPYEELETPSRVHVDPFGHVQVCQGISIGNVWETELAQIVDEYEPQAHPICGPLLRGGPARLASDLGVRNGATYVDECHMCYVTRRRLLDRYPEQLAPRQVYGMAGVS